MFQLEKHMVAYLAANSIGTVGGTTSWCIFRSQLPVTPYTAIVITETQGTPYFTLGDMVGNQIFFNIIVRGNAGLSGWNAAKAKADDIFELLGFNAGITIENISYRSIKAVTNIIDGGTDKNNCPIFSMNFRCIY